MQDGILNPETRFECTGVYTLGGRDFKCANRSGHGEVNLREALVESCNVYFYRLSEQVGLDRLARVAGDFGLGRRSGIGINAEASGFIPTRSYYERIGRRFRIGYTLNTAIGQGDTRSTLVQLAMSYGAIANGGTLYVPQLVERVTSPSGAIVEEFEPRVRRRVHVDQEHLALIIDGLYGAVNDQSGTAFDARIDGGIPVAGKTGTAENRYHAREGDDPELVRYYNTAHAWFAGFAPAEDPEVAIVVLIPHGGSGGRHAAPIALRVMQEYLGGDETTASLDRERRGRLARAGAER